MRKSRARRTETKTRTPARADDRKAPCRGICGRARAVKSAACGSIRKQSCKTLPAKRRLLRYRVLHSTKEGCAPCFAFAALQRFCGASRFLQNLCFLIAPRCPGVLRFPLRPVPRGRGRVPLSRFGIAVCGLRRLWAGAGRFLVRQGRGGLLRALPCWAETRIAPVYAKTGGGRASGARKDSQSRGFLRFAACAALGAVRVRIAAPPVPTGRRGRILNCVDSFACRLPCGMCGVALLAVRGLACRCFAARGAASLRCMIGRKFAGFTIFLPALCESGPAPVGRARGVGVRCGAIVDVCKLMRCRPAGRGRPAGTARKGF